MPRVSHLDLYANCASSSRPARAGGVFLVKLLWNDFRQVLWNQRLSPRLSSLKCSLHLHHHRPRRARKLPLPTPPPEGAGGLRACLPAPLFWGWAPQPQWRQARGRWWMLAGGACFRSSPTLGWGRPAGPGKRLDEQVEMSCGTRGHAQRSFPPIIWVGKRDWEAPAPRAAQPVAAQPGWEGVRLCPGLRSFAGLLTGRPQAPRSGGRHTAAAALKPFLFDCTN